MLRRISLCLAFSVAAAAVVPAFAQQVSPVAARQAVMKSVGAAAKTGGMMMQGELPFDPTVAALVLATMHAAAHGVGAHFTQDAQSTEETEASPKIWENPQGFQERLTAFQTATAAGVQAAPQDLDSFKAAFGPVVQNCKSCHEGFRITKQQ